MTKLKSKTRSDSWLRYFFAQLFFHSHIQKYLLHIYPVPDALLAKEALRAAKWLLLCCVDHLYPKLLRHMTPHSRPVVLSSLRLIQGGL